MEREGHEAELKREIAAGRISYDSLAKVGLTRLAGGPGRRGAGPSTPGRGRAAEEGAEEEEEEEPAAAPKRKRPSGDIAVTHAGSLVICACMTDGAYVKG